jgi:transcription initiation factor IIE alpha subunit
MKQKKNASDWHQLAILTMTRLILFNKRRRAEVKDLKVEEYVNRPKWHEQAAGEMAMALSATGRMLAKR